MTGSAWLAADAGVQITGSGRTLLMRCWQVMGGFDPPVKERSILKCWFTALPTGIGLRVCQGT
eukprot:6214143-Pleurochrysis_carterae.AAC.3